MAEKTGSAPTDQGKKGGKHHIINNTEGMSLAVVLTASNVNDVSEPTPLVHVTLAIKGKRGQPRSRPERVQSDRLSYDSNAYWERLKQMGIESVMTRQRAPHGSGLGKVHGVIEQIIALMLQFYRLRHHIEKHPGNHQAFLFLAASLFFWNQLKQP